MSMSPSLFKQKPYIWDVWLVLHRSQTSVIRKANIMHQSRKKSNTWYLSMCPGLQTFRATDIYLEIYWSLQLLKKKATHCGYWHRNVSRFGVCLMVQSHKQNFRSWKKEETAVNKIEGHKSKGFLVFFEFWEITLERTYFPKGLWQLFLWYITFVSQEPHAILVHLGPLCFCSSTLHRLVWWNI